MNAKHDAPRAVRTALGGVTSWVLLLGAALAWRLAVATHMPAIARDGVQFCWQARDLGVEGVSLLRSERYPQHPAFPALTLATQRALLALGWADEPLTWQTAGQTVALLSGLAVIALTAALTHAVGRRLFAGSTGDAGRVECDRGAAARPAPPGKPAPNAFDPQASRAAMIAAAIAALLPLHVWLSVDVMSDELHAAFYVAGALAMLSAARVRGAALAGLCGGLAFLTRPEGAAVWLATVLLIASQVGRRGAPRRASAAAEAASSTRFAERPFERLGLRAALVRITAATAAFAACATPYWVLNGSLSAKLDKEALEEFLPAERTPAAAPAALLRESVPPHLLVPRTLYETGRAGRVVVPLLALAALVALRRRLARPPVLGLLLCMGIHFGLSAWNLHRAGYLDPRHTLVVVALLTPLAALALAAAVSFFARRGRRWVGAALVAISLAPLAAYAARIPNADAVAVRETARVIRQSDPLAASRLLLGGSSQKRIAFYANMLFQAWPENEPELAARYVALREHILHFRPDYFAIELGAGRELAGNRRLADELAGDVAIRSVAELAIGTVSGPASSVRLVSFRWKAAERAPDSVGQP